MLQRSKKFLDKDFLLQTATALRLYENYAESLPVIDYHSHLSASQLAENINFDNLTRIWLYGDHYKWRAMRAYGVSEEYITGNKSDEEKFMKWAETVPYTVRNPLYHWTHLELRRYFGITDLLSPSTAEKIYRECSQKLRTSEFKVLELLKKMKVEVVGTTDDPTDDLAFHQKITLHSIGIKVVPTFRPDKAISPEDPVIFRSYVNLLGKVCGREIQDLEGYLSALKSRHDFFHQQGCRSSDHGLEHLYAELSEKRDIEEIFDKSFSGGYLDKSEVVRFKSYLLMELAGWNHEKGWVQQFHIGAIRNNSTRLLEIAGQDAGCDSIGDFSQARALSVFLDRLDARNSLTKTIIYNLNPADNELIATMAGNFNDGITSGKIQFGAAWWFLDQKEGIIRQLNALSGMGLISKFVGMVTDSRSFLSYPRHEYFRRILCDIFGSDMERGELPQDEEWIGKIIGDICYYNAKSYFNY